MEQWIKSGKTAVVGWQEGLYLYPEYEDHCSKCEDDDDHRSGCCVWNWSSRARRWKARDALYTPHTQHCTFSPFILLIFLRNSYSHSVRESSREKNIRHLLFWSGAVLGISDYHSFMLLCSVDDWMIFARFATASVLKITRRWCESLRYYKRDEIWRIQNAIIKCLNQHIIFEYKESMSHAADYRQSYRSRGSSSLSLLSSWINIFEGLQRNFSKVYE